MEYRRKPPDHFLTDDEMLELRVGGVEVAYRICVWQGERVFPIVLTSSLGKDGLWPRPEAASVKLANYIIGGILGHPSVTDMSDYEDDYDPTTNQRTFFDCCFDRIFSRYRTRFQKPERTIRPWGLLEHILRQTIERRLIESLIPP